MFKEKKIKEFIEKYAAEFANHDYKELSYFLKKIDDIEKSISKINKLQKNDKYYVMCTLINYKKYNLDEKDIDLIINHKLGLIKKFGSSKNCPVLERIYSALTPNRYLYVKFVSEYINKDNPENDSILSTYSRPLTRYYKEFNDMLDTDCSSMYLKRQLLYLKPEHLEVLLEFNNGYSTKENKKRLFNYLIKNVDLKESIQSLNIGDFNDLLKFVFSKPIRIEDKIEDSINIKIELLPTIISNMNSAKEYGITSDFVNNLKQVPTSFLEQLSDKESETSLEKYKFIEAINKYKEQEIIDMAIERLNTFQSKKNASMFVKFITDDFFVNSNTNRQKMLLNMFPEETIKMDINGNLDLVIPDSSSICGLSSSYETLEFVNPETKMKIYIKTKNQQND